MRSSKLTYQTIAACAVFQFGLHCNAAEVASRFTWMLPKTVIDTTIAYTFKECAGGKPLINITPTLAAKAIPDLLVGQMQLATGDLQSITQDRGISLQTFGSSRILNSIGSSPTSQVAQIGGNILGGIAKLVAVAFGVPATAADKSTSSPPTTPLCASDSNPESAPAIANQIKRLKTEIQTLQAEIAGLKSGPDPITPPDQSVQRRDTAAIAAAQTLITTLQDKLTITIKTTIDPGVTPVVVNTNSDGAPLPIPTRQSVVQNSGLVATICPSKKQLDNAKWFSNIDKLFEGDKTACAAVPNLNVNVYLDFPHGHGTMYDGTHQGKYEQTQVSSDDLYRDVGYIPVLVWRGVKSAKSDDSNPPTEPVQLAQPMTMAFGQFGVAQVLDLKANAFKSLTWQVTFLEDGEITAASFTSKAVGVTATSLFGTAASAANSIATEQRSAANPENQATALQGQADLIYQRQRLALCEANPSTCPSK